MCGSITSFHQALIFRWLWLRFTTPFLVLVNLQFQHQCHRCPSWLVHRLFRYPCGLVSAWTGPGYQFLSPVRVDTSSQGLRGGQGGRRTKQEGHHHKRCKERHINNAIRDGMNDSQCHGLSFSRLWKGQKMMSLHILQWKIKCKYENAMTRF